MSGQAKRRVLVVEDEVLVAMLVEEMLGQLGHEVVALSTHLDEAVRLAGSASFDFAMLDINLNGERSFPVADVLIERGLPFIFATGYGAKILPPYLANRPLLQKPYSLDELRRVVDRLALR